MERALPRLGVSAIVPRNSRGRLFLPAWSLRHGP